MPGVLPVSLSLSKIAGNSLRSSMDTQQGAASPRPSVHEKTAAREGSSSQAEAVLRAMTQTLAAMRGTGGLLKPSELLTYGIAYREKRSDVSLTTA